MLWLQYLSWLVGLSLEVMVIWALLSGPYRRFPLPFAYSVTLFLTTIIEVSTYTAVAGGLMLANSRAVYYWVNDSILQVLIFCVVISLIYEATGRARRAAVFRRWVIAGAGLLFVLSFVSHRDPGAQWTTWMTAVSRDLSFFSVVLDLLLWSILIARRNRNQQLLMLSGGLGVQFTGAAIGQSLRQLSRSTVIAGNLILVLSALMCLYVWWQTFRMKAARLQVEPATACKF